MAGSFFDAVFGGANESIKSKAQLSVQDVVNVASTGDILLFRGWSSTSSFIQIMTASTWSHIAMIIRIPQYNNGEPMVLESIHSDDDHVIPNYKPLLDIKTRKPHCGVRLIDLKEYLVSIVRENIKMSKKSTFKRIEVVYRALSFPLVAENLYAAFLQHLNDVALDFISENRGKRYEENPVEIILARLQIGDTSGHLTSETLFCSELVGYFLLKADLVDLKFVTPNSLLPDDFSSTNHMSLKYPTQHIPQIIEQVDDPDQVIKFSPEFVIDTVTRISRRTTHV